MIYWPHTGLAGEFGHCEDIVSYLNRNTQIIDALMQMGFKGFVSSYPSSPEIGDVYILEDNPYTYESSDSVIISWNGTNWVQIEPKQGFIAYNNDDKRFYFFNDSLQWQILPITDGDVKGPSSSLNREIAVFDGTTGKFITQSGTFIDVDKVATGFNSIYSEEIVSTKIKAGLISSLVQANIQTGEDVVVDSIVRSIVDFNGAIDSIASITAPTPGHAPIVIIRNNKATVLRLKNSASLVTGTGADIIMQAFSSLIISYDFTGSYWFVVGGSGSGGGLIVRVNTFSDLNLIPVDDRIIGALYYVIDRGVYYGTTGDKENDKWFQPLVENITRTQTISSDGTSFVTSYHLRQTIYVTVGGNYTMNNIPFGILFSEDSEVTIVKVSGAGSIKIPANVSGFGVIGYDVEISNIGQSATYKKVPGIGWIIKSVSN